MDSMASSPGDKNKPPAEVLPKTTTIELHGDEFWPLSGKPYFHAMITESNLREYQVVVPVKFHPVLPSLSIPTSLIYCGKKWRMVYSGKGTSKRINNGWKAFAIDNNLKIGDACVYELTECSSKEVTFRVQILRGDLPSEFLDEMNGKSACTPIDVDWLSSKMVV